MMGIGGIFIKGKTIKVFSIMSLNELLYKQIEANDENVGGEGITLSNTH